MCGIAGSVGPTLLDAAAMTSSLTHRGPDSAGLRAFPGCALGMRRLRVVDLRPEADQPMRGETDDVWVVYNGELYNHVELRRELEDCGHTFRSLSDTEVIVHGYEQWGDDVVLRLRGMFAFAIWDDSRSRLLLARDRLGIKPLYLLDEAGTLSFASEARALGPRPLRPEAVVSYLRLGWVGAGGTIGASVEELPPGHLLVREGASSRTERYWEPEWRDEALDPERLRAALEESVARHLVADVPVGVFLSSGVDSTVIAALAARHDPDLRTYTVAFNSGPNEVDAAARLAADLGVSHEIVDVRDAEMTAAIPLVVNAMDQPTVDGVNSWLISQAVRSAGLTVALSGLGGDELFQGYSTFRRVPQVAAVGARLPRVALSSAARLAGVSQRTRHGRMGRAVESSALGGVSSAYAGVRGLHSWATLARLWPAGSDLGVSDETILEGEPRVGGLELANYLRYQLLRDTDVMSMAHSLEVRVPLLDDEVVAAALCLHPAESGLSGKAVLASAAGPVATAAALRPKLTFSPPFDRWLREDLRGWARGSLDALGRSELGFSRMELAALDRAFMEGHVQWRGLWSLCILGAWLDVRQPAR
jgi:asparagine synthase (glutamine-hydrolysing)